MIGEKRQLPFFCILLGVVVAFATAVRIAPLIEGGDRLQRQCVSEDGYLMLTIARNIALGRGFSVSDGMIPSNGTQPLCALLYALCFWATGAHKLSGLYPVVGLQVVTAIATTVLLFLFVRKYLYKGAHSGVVALITAGVWYASPTSILHGQNSLETGAYVLLLLCSIALYDAIAPRLYASRRVGLSMLLGLVLGMTFLSRNDACFLIAAMLGVHLYRAHRRGVLGRGFVQALAIGVTSVIVALPWLSFNISQFGHVVPVSGRAEALHISFGHNLLPAFVAMLENSLVVLRIPGALEANTLVRALSIALLGGGVLLACVHRQWLAERFSAGVGILACHVLALFVYYALFFGMPSFLGRYFFPGVTLFAVIGAAVVVAAAVRMRHPLRSAVIPGAALFGAAACIGLDARIYARGEEHLHFQVVDWVADNVSEDTWIGAVQTGTLGYHHDRTINLDGKVDPYAFAAREQGRIHEYVVERNVEYIVDWVGIAEWAERPEFSVNYELILEDPEMNLAVLRRRLAPRMGHSNRR